MIPTTALILAGGRGTRSADPSKAKLAQDVGGATLLQWHADLLSESRIERAIIVAGYLADQVRAVARSVTAGDLELEVVEEPEQRGTNAAARFGADHSPDDRFLIILGDILTVFDVDAFLRAWEASARPVAVIVHPSTHPVDSDAAFPSSDGSVRVIRKGEDRTGVPNMSSAGVFAVTRDALEQYADAKDIGSDLLSRAASSDDLFAFVSSHYFKDTGTPDRLAAATADVAAGTVQRRGARAARPALFLDRDGVITPNHPELHDPALVTLLPGIAEAIGDANRRGIPVIVLTNQPGIAKGFMTEGVHEAVRARMDALLAERGAFVDDYWHCPHHPERGFPGEVPELKIECDCRKPATGLARAAAAQHGIDLARSVMVGDTERDAGLAEATGMAFIHVADACSLTGDHACETMAATAIERGIGVLPC